VGATIQAGGLNVSAEPLRDLLARRFEEIKGRPFDSEVDFAEAEQTEELKPILDALSEAGLKYGSAGALRGQAIDQTKLNLETEARLPELAQRYQSGEAAVGPELMRRYEDYKNDLAGTFALNDVLKGKDTDPKSKTAKDAAAWRAITPRDDKYTDPETAETDWDAYFNDKKEAYAKLPDYVRTAMEGRLQTADPALQALEPELKRAQGLVDEIYDQPKYEGLSKGKERALDDFIGQVNQTTERLKREAVQKGLKADAITRVMVATALGRKQKAQESNAARAILVFRGDLPLNQDRIQFVLDNQEILAAFFPQELRRFLPVDVERQFLGEEEFEQVIR
jgi:hypothetical protein